MNTYPSLELGQPGKQACPDNFSGNSTILCPDCTKLTIQVAVAAIYIQFGTGIAAVQWGVEEPLLPLVGSITRNFDAFRVRNFTAGLAEPAQVLLTPISAGA